MGLARVRRDPLLLKLRGTLRLPRRTRLPERIAIALFVLVIAIVALVPRATHADDALPAALCALITGRVICYDDHGGAPVPVTPANLPVTDFAPSPDGLWLAYRAGLPGMADQQLYLAPIDGSSGTAASTIADSHATPSADLRLNAVTLAWAPDGIALAYVTAAGLRVSVPTGKADITDQAYINLRWSPDGTQLAAQVADGGWLFFSVRQPLTGGVVLTVTRRLDQAADIAWFDNHSVIAAPIYGGLQRFDASANTPPMWTVPDEHFIRLQSGMTGQVLALYIVPGDPNSTAVQIDADGHWSAFGKATLDPQLTWGPAPGNLLVYITSGTPIMVDRATGSEDMLPINHADRIVWRYGKLPEALGVAMDADLYFIAPDGLGIAQLWRLPRDSFPLLQLTNSTAAVKSYELGPDTIRYTAGNGGQSAFVGLNGSTATPFPLRSATNPARGSPTANAPVTPTRPPFVTLTPGAPLSPAYQTLSVGWQPGPVAMRRVKQSANGSNADSTGPYLIQQPILSPGGGFAAGFRSGRLMILNWATGQAVAIQGIQSAQQIQWRAADS